MSDIIKTIELLTQEFDGLLLERTELRKRLVEVERKIAGLHHGLQGLAAYARAQDDPPLDLSKIMPELIKRLQYEPSDTAAQKGLAECCREALQVNRGWMSPTEVRLSLLTGGFDFSKYTSNPLASIHTTLKRLKDAGEVDDKSEGETTYYKWKLKKTTFAAKLSEQLMQDAQYRRNKK